MNKPSCATTYKLLYHLFNSLGRRVSKYPSWFIVVPIFVTIILATGLHKLEPKLDMEYYITVDNSETLRNRDLIETLFPMDISTEFDLGRYTRPGRFVIVNIKAKNGESLLREDVAEEIVKLNNLIDNVTIVSDSRTYRYEDLCVRNEGKCFINDALSLYLEHGSNFSFKYPMEFYNNYVFKFYGNWMGGVEVNEVGVAKSVKAIRLMYFLHNIDPLKSRLSTEWQLKFLEDVRPNDFRVIDILSFVSKGIEYEMASTFPRSLPYMMVASTLVLAFTMATCIVPNWIKGKPWTGVTTALGSALASLSGFGLVSYFGVPYLYYNILIPFLVLGVSMDDTFVFLSAWRRTDSNKSMEERLGEAYAESSVAISLTSMTNIVSFAAGALMAPYPCVRVFCMLTSFCLLFDYIYQITFVGACMVVFGRAEKNNRHCLTMIPVKPLKRSEGSRGCMHQILYYTGHYYQDMKDTSFLLTMWDTFGDILTKTPTKVIVLVSFGAYVSIALWSATSLNSEIEPKDMAFYDSPTFQFLKETGDIFQQYLERIQVVVPYTLDYSDPKVNDTLQRMFDTFESTDFLCNSTMSESWLKSYHEFLSDPRFSAITSSYNITDKRDFIKALRGLFLRHPATKRFSKDILFNDNYTEIIASRFFFQTNYTKSDTMFHSMWWDFQRLANSFSIHVVLFHRFSFFSEGFKLMIPATLQALGVASCAVAIVSYIFLCSVKCTLCVTFCILSIIIGVLGYMNIWGVNLNIVSATVLMLVSGFAIDYSSHVVCAYVSSSGTSSEKVRRAIREVGLPIFQASATTLLAVSVFVVPPSYSFMVLFKIIFLLSILASTHALIILPVFLSLLEDTVKCLTRTTKRKYSFETTPSEKQGHINRGAELCENKDVDSVKAGNGKVESSNF